MSWTMVGTPISTAEMATAIPSIYQRFRLPTTKFDSLLHGVGLGVILYGDPAFTNLYAELWADRDSAPISLLATTETVYTKAQLLTQYTHGYKYVGMKFQKPVQLKAGTYYHIALRASGYTGNDSSHLAWRHAYPDPQYSAGLGFTVEAIKAAKVPYETLFFCAEH